MADILTSLERFFSNVVANNIVVAYSGGVDSQVLLHALSQLKKQQRLTLNVSVCHVNHGLSENANRWQEFANQQCQKANFLLTICQVELEIKPQQSLEAIAREARYQALQSASQPDDLIVTGHHSDDQAETFLLALKRGSGIKGLSSMSTAIKLGQQLLVRPLLNHSRREIESYANEHQLDWIEDESNADESFDRNFLRHQILPILNARWPSINKTIVRSASLCSEAQELMDELGKQDLEHCLTQKNILCCDALIRLTTARFNNVMRYFLQLNRALMPSSQQLKEIRQQLNAEKDKTPVVQLEQYCLRRYQNKLYLTDIYVDISMWHQNVKLLYEQKYSQSNDVILPDNLGFLRFLMTEKKQNASEIDADWQAWVKAPTPEQKIAIRFVHHNPKCLPDYRQQSRSLKKVLQELSIPSWQRKRLPFIYYDDELVAVIGHFVCQPYLTDNENSALYIQWQQ